MFLLSLFRVSLRRNFIASYCFLMVLYQIEEPGVAGSTPACDSGCRGFEPRQPPHIFNTLAYAMEILPNLEESLPKMEH